jgi:hypothetical protein
MVSEGLTGWVTFEIGYSVTSQQVVILREKEPVIGGAKAPTPPRVMTVVDVARILNCHCEEPLRRSNPSSQQEEKRKLDCFVARAPRNDVERSVGALNRPRADDDSAFPRKLPQRHCERSEAIHLTAQRKNGLLRRKSSSQRRPPDMHLSLAAPGARGFAFDFRPPPIRGLRFACLNRKIGQPAFPRLPPNRT